MSFPSIHFFFYGVTKRRFSTEYFGFGKLSVGVEHTHTSVDFGQLHRFRSTTFSVGKWHKSPEYQNGLYSIRAGAVATNYENDSITMSRIVWEQSNKADHLTPVIVFSGVHEPIKNLRAFGTFSGNPVFLLANLYRTAAIIIGDDFLDILEEGNRLPRDDLIRNWKSFNAGFAVPMPATIPLDGSLGLGFASNEIVEVYFFTSVHF